MRRPAFQFLNTRSCFRCFCRSSNLAFNQKDWHSIFPLPSIKKKRNVSVYTMFEYLLFLATVENVSRAVDKPCSPPGVAPSLLKIYLQVKSPLKQKHLIPLRGPPTSLLVSQSLLEPERTLVTLSLPLSRKPSPLLNQLHSFRRPSLPLTQARFTSTIWRFQRIYVSLAFCRGP